MPAWFEAPSLADIPVGRDAQAPGIRDAVTYINRLLEDEIMKLGGHSEKLFLGGISQGGATAMLALLSRGYEAEPRLGNTFHRLAEFLATSAWLPFACDIDQGRALDTAGNTIFELVIVNNNPDLLETPFLFGHGIDDAYVDVELGREANRVLKKTGFKGEWKEYSGAEQEGHWLQTPDQVGDITAFLHRNM